MQQTFGCLVCLLTSLLAAGCGKQGPEIIPVTGKITNQGRDWPAAGEVLLAPLAAAPGEPVIPAIVPMASDGTFIAECNAGSGLVPGKYRIGVQCWELPPDESRAQSPLGKSYVPAKYQNPATSGFSFEVPVGSGPVNVTFDVAR